LRTVGRDFIIKRSLRGTGAQPHPYHVPCPPGEKCDVPLGQMDWYRYSFTTSHQTIHTALVKISNSKFWRHT